MKALRVNTLTSTLVPVADSHLIPFAPIDPDTNQPFEGVLLRLRPISETKYREIVKARTETVKGPGGVQERVDFEAVRNDCVAYAVAWWTGILGADGKPLPCVDPAKLALDFTLKVAIQDRAMRTEPVEVSDASFCEPADVPGMVGG